MEPPSGAVPLQSVQPMLDIEEADTKASQLSSQQDGRASILECTDAGTQRSLGAVMYGHVYGYHHLRYQ